MTRAVPWDEIQAPDRDYNVRLIGGGGVAPLFWAKDTEGHCLFVIELEGDHTEQFRKNNTSVNGIRVDLRMLDASRGQGLVLTLEQHVDKDLFFGLCETLVQSLGETKDSAAALAVALAHLKRWKAFLAGKKTRMLSTEEIRGLFGELQFLRMLYQGPLDQTAAVDAWCGPDRIHQDFIFGDIAVETKALSGRERSAVRISSEDQLETLCDNLFLTVFRLSDMPESDQALSLNEAVRRIEGELSDSDVLEAFGEKLGAYGYVEMREYDKPRFIVTAQQTYRVEDDFPRLIRSALPDGIARLSYDIELEKIAPFECETEDIWGG